MTYSTLTENLLTVTSLSITFTNNGNKLQAVRNVDLTMKKGEIVGLVGESGSGKSVTALTIADLLPSSKNIQVNGKVLFNDADTMDIPKAPQRHNRKVAMIFQDPFDSLNPAFTIGYQIQEVFIEKLGLKKRQARAMSIEMLKKVRISSPEKVAEQYPHQLSGGMCQRVMIAMALAAEAELLIADEPTTALDVTIQAQILQLLYEQHRNTQTSILFITHDLGVVAQLCNSVAIMLEGEIVEQGPTSMIFKHPQHPYTKGLLNSIPALGQKRRLQPIPPPGDMDESTHGCGFFPRCTTRYKDCCMTHPTLTEYSTGHYVRCIACNGDRP